MSVRVIFFPAECGDSSLVEFPNNGDIFRILIDGGTPSTGQRLATYLKKNGSCLSIDLVIVTHIDNDHIGGIIPLLQDPEINSAIKEIWFNGLRQLGTLLPSTVKSLSVKQGIELEKILTDDPRWNSRFGNSPIALNHDGSARNVDLVEGAKVQILSPGNPELQKLKKNWVDVLEDQNAKNRNKDKLPPGVGTLSTGKNVDRLANSLFDQDTAFANGSSIAFLLQIGCRNMLFTGDAFPKVIHKAALTLDEYPINLALFKISHHGSSGNTNEDIVKQFPSENYLISTDGSHGHPDDETIARLLVHSPQTKTLTFNYPNIISDWGTVDFANQWKCEVKCGDGVHPIVVELGDM